MNRTMVVAIGIVAVLLLAGCPNPMDPMSGAGDEVDRVDALGRESRTPPPSETGFFPDRNAERFALRSYLGWTFEAVAKSEDGRIVVGNAVNENGYDRGRYEVAAGTTAGVYWVTGTTRGRDWALGPFVIGIVKDDITESRRHRALYRQILTRFGLFSLDSFESRLASVDTIGNGESEKTYIVTGSGSDGTALAATIEGTKVVLVEVVADDPGDQPAVTNSPPTVRIYGSDDPDTGIAGDLLVRGAATAGMNGVYGPYVSATYDGQYRGAYAYSNGSFNIFYGYYSMSDFTSTWYLTRLDPVYFPSIAGDENLRPSPGSYLKYPPTTGWLEADRETSAGGLSVHLLPFDSDIDVVDGSMYADGAVLTVFFEYNDTDGDPQAGTVVRWYRFDPVTDPERSAATLVDEQTIDDGATNSQISTSSYTVSSTNDGGHAFYVTITPNDGYDAGAEIGSAESRTVANL
jgi:hypothetical protein